MQYTVCFGVCLTVVIHDNHADIENIGYENNDKMMIK